MPLIPDSPMSVSKKEQRVRLKHLSLAISALNLHGEFLTIFVDQARQSKNSVEIMPRSRINRRIERAPSRVRVPRRHILKRRRKRNLRLRPLVTRGRTEYLCSPVREGIASMLAAKEIPLTIFPRSRDKA